MQCRTHAVTAQLERAPRSLTSGRHSPAPHPHFFRKWDRLPPAPSVEPPQLLIEEHLIFTFHSSVTASRVQPGEQLCGFVIRTVLDEINR